MTEAEKTADWTQSSLQSVTDTQRHFSPAASEAGADDDGAAYLQGIRLWLLSSVIFIMLFLVSLDTTITTTSLVPITQELGGFQTASWLLSAYQLGWVAVIAIFAKFSDIFGRKPVFVVSIFIFMVFSAGCAGSRTMPQLIILRAFQGIGGGGCFALTTILMTEVVRPENVGAFASRINIGVILSLVLGPILGGAISSNTSWRWIFWINVPISAIALLLALVGIPNGFPNHGKPNSEQGVGSTNTSTLDRVDLLGAVLLLIGTLAFAACFQEAGSHFAWDSSYVIALLVVSIVVWAALLVWERYITLQDRKCEPLVPWRILTNRITAAVLMDFVLVGVPLVATNFELPQRFQLVNGLSSIDAGLRILPFGVSFCVGSIIGSVMSTKVKVAGIYQLLLAGILQVIGYALLSKSKASVAVEPAIYAYQVICGIGVGISSVVLYLLVPRTVEQRDKAVALGLASQFRTMGSIFGLSIITSVFNGYTAPRLASLGTSADPTSIQDLVAGKNSTVPMDLLDDVREILSEGYNHQMLVLLAVAAAQVATALLLWKRKQITLV